MTATHHKSKEKRQTQIGQEHRARRRRRCPECLQQGAMTRVSNGHRCRVCGATYLDARV